MKLTERLRDYSPENKSHVVHEAADRIDALEECLRELVAAFDHGHEVPEIVKARALLEGK